MSTYNPLYPPNAWPNTSTNSMEPVDREYYGLRADTDRLLARLRQEMGAELQNIKTRLNNLEKFYQFVMAIHPEIYNEYRTCVQVTERLERDDDQAAKASR